MKLAFRLSNLGFGGAERVFLSVGDYLRQQHGVEIDFVLDNGTGETVHEASSRGFGIVDLGANRTIRTFGPLKRYIERARPDLLISAYTDTNIAALVSARWARPSCPVIVTEHASLDEHWQGLSKVRRLGLGTAVKTLYPFANHVLCVSAGIEQQIRTRLGHAAKTSFIHNPVRFRGSAAAVRPEGAGPKRILAVGRICVQKDYATLLRAFREVRRNMDVELVVVGGVFEQEVKQQLDAYVASEGLERCVRFVGYTDSVQDYYANADLFVLSSAWEGFGNVIVEALAFGLPVVSTDCHYGPSEILEGGRYGTLVGVGDAGAMAREMLSSLRSAPVDRAPLIERSACFSEERIGSQYWDLIQRVVHNS